MASRRWAALTPSAPFVDKTEQASAT